MISDQPSEFYFHIYITNMLQMGTCAESIKQYTKGLKLEPFKGRPRPETL